MDRLQALEEKSRLALGDPESQNEDEERNDEDEDDNNNEDDVASDEGEESQEERLSRIAQLLAEAGSGFDGEFEVVDEIDGARLQACAFHGSEGDYVRVTCDLMEELDDDELAFVLSHEIAHHEHRDNERLKQLAEESSEVLTMGLKSLNDDMKTKGRGWLARGLIMSGATLLGAAAGMAAMQGSSRKHENEADERGIELAVAAGFDPDKVESALVKLHGGYLPDIGAMGTLMSNHPNPTVRGNTLQRQAERHKRSD